MLAVGVYTWMLRVEVFWEFSVLESVSHSPCLVLCICVCKTEVKWNDRAVAKLSREETVRYLYLLVLPQVRIVAQSNYWYHRHHPPSYTLADVAKGYICLFDGKVPLQALTKKLRSFFQSSTITKSKCKKTTRKRVVRVEVCPSCSIKIAPLNT